VINIAASDDPDDYKVYRAKQSFSGTSDNILVSSAMTRASVVIHPSGGTARVEFTLSTPAEITAATALWVVWSAGDVAFSTLANLPNGVTAIRGIAVSSAVIELCGV